MKTKTKRIYLLIFALVAMVSGAKAESTAYAEYKDSTLTFKFGELPAGGLVYDLKKILGMPGWYSYHEAVKTVVFDTSFSEAHPQSCELWFYQMTSLTSIQGIENLNTSEVTTMSNMFCGCSALTSIDLSNFNTTNVEYMGLMFASCSSLKTLDLSKFNTEKVKDMSSMFLSCSRLSSLNLSSFNTEKVTNMANMFHGCGCLTSLDLSNFNTSNVTDMNYMFERCANLTNLNVSGFNTSKVSDMNHMFANCIGLSSLDVSSFNTLAVENMASMFYNCLELRILDVSGFNTSQVTSMDYMFCHCERLSFIYCNESWQRSGLTSSCMFDHCQSLIGAMGYYDAEKTNADYANPETGYFTYKVDTFAITINSKAVTSLNCNDLTAIPGVTGKASYDSETKTLYLENANITEMTMAGGLAMENKIDSLKINVKGDCSISSTAGTGIKNTSKTLIITGTGTLDITAGNNGIVMTNTAANNLVVDGKVTVNVTADNYGVQGREYEQHVLGGTTRIYYRTTLKVGGANSKLSVNGAAKCFHTLGGFIPAAGYKVTAPSRTAYYDTDDDVAYYTFCKLSVSFGKELSGSATTTLTPVAGTAVVIENTVTYQPGDVNHDGSITMADANAVVNYFLATDKPEDFDVTTANVNGDDGITMADANMIVNMFLGQ